MPVYAYKGLGANGKQVSGVKDADSVRALKLNLKRDGIFITDVEEANLKSGPGKGGKAVKGVKGGGITADDVAIGVTALVNPVAAMRMYFEKKNADSAQVAILTRQLGVLLKAGVPLSESLGALIDQSEQAHVKRILADVKQQVNEGSSLADALSRHPGSFEDLFINMIRAGEASGALEAVLFRLAEFLDAQNRLRSKIISAMFYPIAMAIMSSVIIAVLMVTVVPKVTTIFRDMGASLPINTRMLIFGSDLIANWWFVILPAMAGAAYGFVRWRRTPSGIARWDRFVLSAPVIGPLARMIAVSRFSKTLATMLASGVPLLRALDIVKNILGNTVLTKVVEEARNSIKEGESIAAPLRRSGEFPPIVTHMIAVGERTGELEQMLENVSASYDVEVEMKISRLTTLLEPLMIVVMGGSVAFIVFSILMPIMQMNEFVS